MNLKAIRILPLLVLLFAGLVALAQDPGDEYRKTIEMADGYFAKGDYINAKASYQIASRLAPDESYPKEMLQQSLAMIREQMQQSAVYSEKIVIADELFNQGDWPAALKVYQEALTILPGDSYANGRVTEINKKIQDNQKLESDFSKSIASADQFLQEGNLESALESYKKAIALKPQETYPSSQVKQVEKMIAERNALAGDYAGAMAVGDDAMKRKRFDEAIKGYAQALTLKPGDQAATQKLESAKKQRADTEAYAAIIVEADNLYVEKEFEQAREKYNQALAIKPDDSYPRTMLEKIDVALMDISQANQSRYDIAIAMADKYYNEQDYDRAMEEYKNASRFKPNDSYATQKINNINQTLAVIRSQNEAYAQAISKADNLFKEKRYEEARDEYQRAIGFNAFEQYPKVKIDEIRVILAELQNQRQVYSELIKGADRLFFSDNYIEALEQYKKASDMFPKEQYPLDQITMIYEILGIRDKYTKAITDADKLLYEKKYDAALAEFRKATELDGKAVYPQGKIYEIEQLKAEQQKQEALRREYDSLLAVADDHFRAGELDLAMKQYQAAGVVLPGDTYYTRKLEEIEAAKVEIRKQEELQAQYDEMTARGDRLLLDGDYRGALDAYQAALNLKPGSTYPKEKISEINGIIGEIAAREALDLQFATAVTSGDQMLSAKNYPGAIESYQAALKLKPGEPYPKDKIAEINGILKEMEARDKLDAQVRDIISGADNLMASGNYPAALQAYQQALSLRPGDPYAELKVTEINMMLAEKEKQEAERLDIISKADNLFTAGDYTAALQSYQTALDLKPGDAYVQSKITESNAMLAQIAEQQKKEAELRGIISRADELFASGSYSAALQTYQEALNLKPGEGYVQSKITETNARLAQIAEQQQRETELREAISAADGLFARSQYEEARQKYNAALTLNPGDPYISGKLREIDAALQEIARKADIDKKFSDAVAAGDRHLAAGDFENARYEYQVASSIKPEERYPLDKIAEMDALLEQIRKQKEIDAEYNKIIAGADALYNEEKIEEARAAYQKALEIKPGESYPGAQLISINRKLEFLASEREKAYEIAISKADNYFEQGDFEMAKIQYERAVELNSEQVYPLDQLKLVNEQIMKKRQVVQAEYDKAIADADKFYASKIYDNAIEAYRNAAQVKTDEEYPKEMIRRILKLLSDRSIVQINKDPLLIPNSTTHRFDFLPVPVKDRKSNYVFFRARNVSDKEYKLIINFGKDQAKGGGVVVKVPPGADLNEFIVRISAQYKWFSDDNNWISFYPEGGDLEVSLLQISYSD